MNDQKTGGSGRFRRIAALAAAALLAGLYLATFVLAVLGDERSAGLLRFCFGMTIFLPLFLWVVIWCVGVMRRKRSIATLDILDSNPEERRRMEEALWKTLEKDTPEKNTPEKDTPEKDKNPVDNP